MSGFIPPTKGSLRCMCWEGYTGKTQEELVETHRAAMTKLPSPETVVKRVREVQLWPPKPELDVFGVDDDE